ncbi:phage tail sheath subtilisin-like domain-containing protein [Catellatospora sp. KI3]|uniref:phage tail sheath family protein n=1 Tax=Catellatospora sp. KI3 TaxID=3041620 RepID=UPI0024831DF8|nr:phage tail sheath subtilisin-like domain-containing protein [Catellatospora sp. KI3]MDI1463776.1 phage tail sheath subtilisin-like domain-containing protein [Catellatospora sp. KI3]
MPVYSSPGIYVEEVSGGSRPIESVGTSTAGFVGTAPDPTARRDEAVAVNSWSEFVRVFVGESTTSTPLSRAVYGFFDNGGGRCYVVNIASGHPLAGKGRQRSGLRLLEAIDEIAIVAAPGYTDAASYEDLLAHCELMGDRMAILDGPEQTGDVERLTRVGGVTLPKPPRKTGGTEGETQAAPAEENSGLRPRQSDYGTFYVPWLVVRDPLTGEMTSTPPSGHVAGVWARTDVTRGVHKAPANEPVRGAVDLSYRVTKAEQDVLNPAGVNCIRHFPAEGIRIWGARTLAASASEWRYLNVRRLFNMLKESIGDGTRWIVFEPNDNLLWKSIRRDIGAFLTRVWRDGALQGRTPQEAFFVKCDEETNPAEVRDAGQVVTLIGIAPVKPAEFVIFKISQSAGTGEQGA